MFENILQPVFSEKPNNLLLKARIYMPTHVGSPESSTATETFHPTPSLVIKWTLHLEAAITFPKRSAENLYIYLRGSKDGNCVKLHSLLGFCGINLRQDEDSQNRRMREVVGILLKKKPTWHSNNLIISNF